MRQISVLKHIHLCCLIFTVSQPDSACQAFIPETRENSCHTGNEMSRPEIPFFQLIGNWQNTMTTHTEHTKISASIISETIPFIFQFLPVYCLYLQYIIL